MTPSTDRVPVLIVGGGACGLSLSIFLSKLGIRSLLIERHPAVGRMPKARYLSQRTMEIYRQFGVADAIYDVSIPAAHIGKARWCTSLGGDGPLDGRTFFEMDAFGAGRDDYGRDSPCMSTLYPQVRLEPLLRSQAEACPPGLLRFSHELVTVEQTDECVLATIRDRTTDETYSVAADFVIAADGGKTVGPIVGASLQGPTAMLDMATLYFRADLSQWMDDDEAMITWFVNPDGGSWTSGNLGKLGPTRFDRHSEEWMMTFSFKPDDPARNDDSALLPKLRDLLNLPDLKAEVLGIGHWIVEGVLAERYQFGRIFLAGDAAHRHPPTTGLGLNSAVQDAHNLAWKLAAVLRGQASQQLLDSYEPERRPVAARNVDWALLTFQNHAFTDVAMGVVRGSPERTRENFRLHFEDSIAGRTRRERLRKVLDIQRMEWQAHDIELGYSYQTGAVVGDGSEAPQSDPLGSIYRPTTRPGHRLPHARLGYQGREISTLDLVEAGDFVLIFNAEHPDWARNVEEVRDRLGIPIRAVSIGREGEYTDLDGSWAALSQIDKSGAILVRPDNHVGWRLHSANPDAAGQLEEAIVELLGLDDRYQQRAVC